MVVVMELRALSPPVAVRQASRMNMAASSSAPKRSSRALTAEDARAVKKSTMMFWRRNWHQGMNSAMAAPAATAVSS